MAAPFPKRVHDLFWRTFKQPYVRPSLLDERWVEARALAEIRALLGEHALVVVDLGARGGARDLLELNDVTRLYGFEPNEEECEPLQRAFFRAGYVDARHFPVALAGAEGERRLVVTRSPGSISFFEPNLETARTYDAYGSMFEPVGELTVPTTTLDAFVSREKLPSLDFLKLDVQAAELEIIEGGRRTLADQVLMLRTEVWFRRFYREQPLFRDLDRALDELGFLPLSIEPFVNNLERFRTSLPPGVGDRGEMLFGDAIYVKDVVRNPALLGDGDPARALRLVLMLESFGFVGYALAAAEALRTHAPEPRLLEALGNAIVARHRGRWYERRPGLERARSRLLRRALGRLPYADVRE
jgi:FkbM family methyltransferase